jgi:hypothetical protein
MGGYKDGNLNTRQKVAKRTVFQPPPRPHPVMPEFSDILESIFVRHDPSIGFCHACNYRIKPIVVLNITCSRLGAFCPGL